MLIVGSSMMLHSGFRFVREARRLGLLIAAVNNGKTRADELLGFKINGDCGTALNAVLDQIDPELALPADKTRWQYR